MKEKVIDWFIISLLAFGLLGMINESQAQPLSKKVYELGNLAVLDNLVEHEDEEIRQAIIAVLLAQQYVESSFNPDAKSSAGALGITQVLPSVLKETLNLKKLPKTIDMDLGIYAQVRYFDNLYYHNKYKLLEIGKKIGIKVKVHHVINMYLIQYIGGYYAFNSDESYERVLRGMRHTEPERRSRYHKPYAVNLYVTKILKPFDILDTQKGELPLNMGLKLKLITVDRINNIDTMLRELGFDIVFMSNVLDREVI